MLGPNDACVIEDVVGDAVFINVFLGEFISLLTSVVAALRLENLLLFFYILIPLLLNLLLIVFAVRREGLMSEQDLRKVVEKESTYMSKTEAFEVADPVHKFMVIEGPQPVIVQFFRHYGHPIRDRNSLWAGERVREVACITIVCCLFFYFPVGLLVSQWSDENAQYLWLSYQLYAVISMYIVRV